MKIKNLLTITFILCLFAFSGNAQKRFILENKGSVINTRIFDNLDSAVAAIQTNDILYIPGGNFGLPSGSTGMVIDKNGVSVIGAGHHPDSTNGTGITYLDGNITIYGDQVSITGVYLTNSVHVFGVTNNPIISSFSMSRCNVGSVRLEKDANNSPETQLSSINNSIIRTTLYGGNASSCSINHNIIEGQVSYFNGSGVFFSYNIFLDNTSGTFNNTLAEIDGATFVKNIFRTPVSISISGTDTLLGSCNLYYSGTSCSGTSNCQNNTFSNNAFNITGNNNIPLSMLGRGVGNNIFNNSDSFPSFISSIGATFDYNKNYNAGGDKGVYGGNGFNYIPRNPHIKSADISEQTDNGGNLQIIFEVEAKQ
jgi:hypothetical protein